MSEPTHYLLDILEDTARTEDKVGAAVAVEMRKYKVLAPDGIFKRGQLWEVGTEIELPVPTGEHLVSVGELEALEGSDEDSADQPAE